ncbi:MAG: hypothetical protein ACJ76N_04095, partial [Thermoanaerobaculia bacterium]
MKPFHLVIILALGLLAVPAAAQVSHPHPPPPIESQLKMLEPPPQPSAAPMALSAPAPGAPGWTYLLCPFAGSPSYPDLPGVCHPYPQPWPAASTQTTTGCPGPGCKTVVTTGQGIFPPSNPFNYETFPGTNFLPTVYTNTFDSQGHEVINTLPSTPDVPYHLQDGDPVVSQINQTSPEDDL